MENVISRIRRTSKLGNLGEQLAAEALAANDFEKIGNLNDVSNNFPFADLLAEKAGRRYFIGVKTRNEERDVGGLNGSYNCILVSGPANARLKGRGLSVKEITRVAIAQVKQLAMRHDAEPAWIAIPVRPSQGTFAAYFGLLDDLGLRRSIPMTEAARKRYACLADWTVDRRVTSDLANRR